MSATCCIMEMQHHKPEKRKKTVQAYMLRELLKFDERLAEDG